MSDRPFADKKSIEGGFDDSPLRLNQFLRQTNDWNAEKIKERAQQLADKATQIWQAPNLRDDVLALFQPEKEPSKQYTFDQYEYLTGDMLTLYQSLKQRIINIDSSVVKEYKKLYIAFKSTTNFVDIVPQKSRLRLSLNMAYPDIIDPKELTKDVSSLGRWGNGDVEVGLSSLDGLDDVMELILQAFDAQFDYPRSN